MGIIECCQSFLQPFAPAAIKVDSRTHTSRIHLGKVMLDSLGVSRPLSATKVVVNINDRESRPADFAHFGN